MAVQLDSTGKDDKNDIKTHFVTREGVYRILNLSSEELLNPRPRPGVGYQSNHQSSPQVRVSFVSLPPAPVSAAAAATSATGGTLSSSSQAPQNSVTGSTNAAAAATTNGPSSQIADTGGGGSATNGSNSQGGDRICFNIGKELYVYSFKGIRKPADLNKPIDKKLYKGTNPSCHDFNSHTATLDGAPLLVGFTTGQIQLVHPGRREQGKLFNEERLIDKTKVTCLKWVPGSANLFLAAHASGHLYLYNEEFASTPVSPAYQPFKCGDGYSVMVCKSKSPRNPLYKWSFGTENYAINEICFSPCGQNLAIVSQDGFLRVFQYNTMELIGIARSYFGGFLCVCWSPDGKYLVVGGEDDLVTVFSLLEKKVVARGQGHRSWVSVVAFDPYTTSYTNWDGPDFSDDENAAVNDSGYVSRNNTENHGRKRTTSARDSLVAPEKTATSYRLGSVGQDTQLCLWDITDDVLRQPPIGHRNRLSSYEPIAAAINGEHDAVPIIKPVAITTIGTPSGGTNKDQVDACAPSSAAAAASKSKFLANCTNVDSSDTTTTLLGISSKTNSLVSNCTSNSGNTSKDVNRALDKSTTSSLATKAENAVGTTNAGSNNNNNSSNSSSSNTNNHSSSSSHHHHTSAFNTLTQKLSNFSFSSDKNNSGGKSHSKKRNFSLSKSSGNHASNSINSNAATTSNHLNGNNNDTGHLNSSSTTTTTLSNNQSEVGANATNSLTKSNKSSTSTTNSVMSASIYSTFDPMKLIGSSACPRFDETPVLEPLVCKKIAHERLTALIFREDCFITACQDGFIYTWARPGYGYQNMQHNLPSSPTVQGGTVV
ncbi:WD repeat-containing protein 20 [Culicoides brevitarsis]|uniref:WD repeat-containing protein 20 n=1 Tax=Culicoides brevitarsis TaxID=469753 RepID=UPI00307C2001